MPASRPLRERLYEKTEWQGDCLVFTGATTRAGYGVIAKGHPEVGMVLAHRAAWGLEVGPIPNAYEVDHLCRVRPCVRISHLEPVTRFENLRRAGCFRYDEEEVVERIALLCGRGLSFTEIANDVGLSRSHVHRLARGWRTHGLEVG